MEANKLIFSINSRENLMTSEFIQDFWDISNFNNGSGL